MADVLDEHAVALQVIFLDAIGVGSVRVNPRTQPRHYAQRAGHRLSFQGFLQLLHRYRICPDLISRPQVLRLYAPHGPSNKKSEMDYIGFLATLGKAAQLIFSGPEWDDQYPNDNDKVRLLLLWMDENSAVFKNNGRCLCDAKKQRDARGIPTNDAVSFTEDMDLLAHVEQLAPELERLFQLYCTRGHSSMSNLSFVHCLRDLGLCEAGSPRHLSTVDMDIIFRQMRCAQSSDMGASSHTVSFAAFHAGLGLVAARVYEHVNPPRCRFLSLALEYILPALVQADVASSCDSNAWRQRWQKLCVLREALLSAHARKGPSVRLPPPSDEVHVISELGALQELLMSKLSELPPSTTPPSLTHITTHTEALEGALERLACSVHARVVSSKSTRPPNTL
ncbi:hypothetical protein SPRG_07576 [Saprolegnia parasitica CBS 223.65]|uniref:Uncharacterized protein n=1 Tax=Saprolegnia parasitica (strain CBS 223.65) TaxID=695850 RepID=A0A067C985_SAPPC|nr:hypothetical protein SPRG_07576 [Saprolegnia parasitica CBS 223.65]KDO27329.1 hypothetical protein SPRG_07576 [Saprolegnia parasitica CBS 223.65]|eukprot:XP_012202100.1 hypothetical protein SPRG_07576 [Saprolegnia parasitica CBS 223.65]